MLLQLRERLNRAGFPVRYLRIRPDLFLDMESSTRLGDIGIICVKQMVDLAVRCVQPVAGVRVVHVVLFT